MTAVENWRFDVTRSFLLCHNNYSMRLELINVTRIVFITIFDEINVGFFDSKN